MTLNPNLSPFQNAGLLHNLALFNLNATFQAIGYDPDPAIVGNSAVSISQILEKETILPAGSTTIISQGLQSFLAATDFPTGLKVWSDLYNQYSADPSYNNTPLLAALSIANFSAQYWCNVVTTWELANGPDHPKPTASNSLFKIPKWLKIVCIDLVGALGGMQAGGAIGSIFPGLGTAIGSAIGGIIGGAAASGAAGN